MSNQPMPLESTRDRLAKVLKQRQVKVVFAESCTAGLCAATMGQVDGISNHLCGSCVTYRPRAKQDWLGVRAETIQRYTTESREVAEEMAMGVLERTPEADWAAAVVGDLAEGTQWRIQVAIARRSDDGPKHHRSNESRLSGGTRVDRQREAARLVLDELITAISAL